MALRGAWGCSIPTILPSSLSAPKFLCTVETSKIFITFLIFSLFSLYDKSFSLKFFDTTYCRHFGSGVKCKENVYIICVRNGIFPSSESSSWNSLWTSSVANFILGQDSFMYE